MGAKQEPSKDITGGLWYHNGELLEEQIAQLYVASKKTLLAKPERAWSVEEV